MSSPSENNPGMMPPAPTSSTLEEQSDTILEEVLAACSVGNLGLARSAITKLKQHPDLCEAQGIYKNFIACAASKGHADVISLLLENGAEVDFVVAKSTTRAEDVHAAIQVFEVFFNHGLNLSDFPGILHGIDQGELLTFLLSKGANPNGLNDAGETPLDCAISLTAIKILIKYGADTSRANLFHTAIGLPDDDECYEWMQSFLKDGVDINSRAVHLEGRESLPKAVMFPRWEHQKGHAGTALHWAVNGFNTRKGIDR